ncbi:MAG: Gfo/Idh/MocA family oxidoreductase [Acidobacteriia bacterium]|nr:Gfo/Idh/MocA family oxidoreductase [Terriglobia bacterium]
MGETYAEVVTKYVQGTRLIVVASPGEQRRKRLAEKYGVRACSSCDELLAIKDVDAVFIATPHAHHAEDALRCAKAGKHLMIDKPMACSVEACDAILEACEARKLKCSVMFTHRARAGNAKAKEIIDSGRLGRVIHLRSYQLVPGGMEIVPKWQQLPENIGLLFGHGIHNLDAARWFTGQEITRVFAKSRNLGPAYPVEGTSDVLLVLADGTVCYIFCSFEVPNPGFPRSGIGARIVCERGLLDIDAYGETRMSCDGKGWETVATQEPIDWAGQGFLDPVRLQAYVANVQAFIDAVQGRRSLPIDGWDGRQAVAAALAAYESSRTNKEIVLAESRRTK